MITSGVNMSQLTTSNFIICCMCKISNNFNIEIIEHKGDYYYSEKCPRERCGHTEEFKQINGREAKRYRAIHTEDPFAQ